MSECPACGGAYSDHHPNCAFMQPSTPMLLAATDSMSLCNQSLLGASVEVIEAMRRWDARVRRSYLTSAQARLNDASVQLASAIAETESHIKERGE